MDIEKILKRFREEVTAINATIRDLERLAATGKVRGRPATWMTAAKGRGRNEAPRSFFCEWSEAGNRQEGLTRWTDFLVRINFARCACQRARFDNAGVEVGANYWLFRFGSRLETR